MKPNRAEKVMFAAPQTVPALAPTPAAPPTPHGDSASLSPRDLRRRAELARLPRWRPTKNILETAAASGRFKTLARAIQGTHLGDLLSEKGPFTLFAPTDEAFAKMPSDDLRSLLADKARLRSVLSYHVVAEKVRAPRAGAPKTAVTVDGRKLTITGDDGRYTVSDARIVETNIRASNGVIHAIDSVLSPG
jgi:uncharacterized surface protein with fasciclin (FAS1) repeats